MQLTLDFGSAEAIPHSQGSVRATCTESSVHFVEIDGVDGEDVLRPAGRRSARHGPHRNVVSVTFERIIVFRRSEHMSDIQHFRIQASSLDLVHEWESAVSTERAHDDTREISPRDRYALDGDSALYTADGISLLIRLLSWHGREARHHPRLPLQRRLDSLSSALIARRDNKQ